MINVGQIRRCAVVALFASLCAVLRADDVVITIKLVNGRNGKPVTAENLSVFAAKSSGIYHPDSNGVIHLKIDRGELISFIPNALVACHVLTQAEKTSHQFPQYKVSEIAERGVSDTNGCSKRVHVDAKPGEFVYFERPLTLLERMNSD